MRADRRPRRPRYEIGRGQQKPYDDREVACEWLYRARASQSCRDRDFAWWA